MENLLTKTRMFNRLSNPMQRFTTALKAVRALLADPEDTEKVFKVIASLRGNSLRRSFDRFTNTPTGTMILRDQVDLLDTLQNRQHLSEMQTDSLAAAYLEFIDSQSLTPAGLVEHSEDLFQKVKNEDVLRYVRRNRDSHDLWHVLTQYGRDPLGETCLLAFTFAQTKNMGLALILIAGSIKLRRSYGHGSIGAVWRAYRDGKKASWLPAQPFEDLLPLNVESVRVMLSVPRPNAYLVVLARQREPITTAAP